MKTKENYFEIVFECVGRYDDGKPVPKFYPNYSIIIATDSKYNAQSIALALCDQVLYETELNKIPVTVYLESPLEVNELPGKPSTVKIFQTRPKPNKVIWSQVIEILGLTDKEVLWITTEAGVIGFILKS